MKFLHFALLGFVSVLFSAVFVELFDFKRRHNPFLGYLFIDNTKKACRMSLFSKFLQESQKKEAAQMQRRHERKKEKRKRSARLQLQVQEQSVVQSQTQPGTTSQTENAHVSPQPIETALPQTEKPQKTVIKTQPKTPKARTSSRLSLSIVHAMITSHSHTMSTFMFRFRRSVTRQ